MSTYREWQPTLHPGPLRGPWGTAWAQGLGGEKDTLLGLAKDAVQQGFVLSAPADSLSRHGADADLERYTRDTDETYRTRIVGAWEAWRWAGTRYGLTTALRDLLGDVGIDIVPQSRWPAPDLCVGLWSRFRVFLTGLNLWGGAPWGVYNWAGLGATPFGTVLWGSAGWLWGDTTWGSTATPDDVESIRGVLRKWKNARDRVHSVVLTFGVDPWGTFLWGGGPWGAGLGLVTWTQYTPWGSFAWADKTLAWGASYFV